ncbi:hypothetical protein J4476_03950 [Candidatus Woesearchaeota archaeon]|nr:MAG: hypothetical protein QT09_C0009G0014 [archaeon GW2011_AR18]MBS3161818.1 hypothetical protein [Candidatus Woesearchaeota archaeon]HIH26069.1 hypothetical protein [Nanoarchaeota archaeon]
MFNSRFKMGQMEIVGLMVVVIIIIIGALFYLKFGILHQEQDNTDLSIEQSYTINWLNSILNVNVCNNTISYKSSLIECYNDGIVCNESACDYAKTESSNIINSIGLKDYRNYSFWIQSGDDLKHINNECKTGVKADEVILSDNGDEYTVNFRIC